MNNTEGLGYIRPQLKKEKGKKNTEKKIPQLIRRNKFKYLHHSGRIIVHNKLFYILEKTKTGSFSCKMLRNKETRCLIILTELVHTVYTC